MDVHRIPRLIRGREADGPGRSFGARRHVDKKPVSTELTPIPDPSSNTPQQRAVPRKSVAFGNDVTMYVRFAAHPRLHLLVTSDREPQVELTLN
jgi:hypothetical protein